MKTTRITAVTALLLSLCVIPAGVSAAEESPKPDGESNVQQLDPNIGKLEKNITPFQAEVTRKNVDHAFALSSDILFDFGKSELSDTAKREIGALVKDVPKGATVNVDGHTDNVPFERGNDVLSKERAQAVANAITAARPDLTTKVAGHGDKEPIEPNEKGGKDNPEGRRKNRRVEISYNG